MVLTIAGGETVLRGEALGAGHTLAHAVAHVAPRGWHQVVRHEAGTVPNLAKKKYICRSKS